MIEIKNNEDKEKDKLKDSLEGSSEAQAKALAKMYLVKQVTSLVGRLGILIASLVMCYLTNSPRWVFVILLYLIF